MSLRLIKQPNGNYGIYESIIDNFLYLNVPEHEIEECLLDIYIDRAKRRAAQDAKQMITTANFHANKNRWAQTIEYMVELHGQEEVDEVLRESELDE